MARIQLYVRLLDEGTEVFRPTEAEVLEDGLYRVLPLAGYDPEDETLEFLPGSIVRGEPRQGPDGEYLVAVESVQKEGFSGR